MATKLLTLHQVCEKLDMNIYTARNRLSSGKSMPPSVRIGRKRLFPEDHFEKWIDRQVESNDEIIAKKFSTGRIRK